MSVPTFIVKHTDKLWAPEQIREAFKRLQKAKATPQERTHSGTIDESDIPADTLVTIIGGVEEGKRSEAFFRVVRDLKEEGCALIRSLRCLPNIPMVLQQNTLKARTVCSTKDPARGSRSN
jgi:hypothetical protein